jgi:hypothetical protein
MRANRSHDGQGLKWLSGYRCKSGAAARAMQAGCVRASRSQMVVGVSSALIAVDTLDTLFAVGLEVVSMVAMMQVLDAAVGAAIDPAMAALGSNRLGLQGQQQCKADQRKLTQHHSAGP